MIAGILKYAIRSLKISPFWIVFPNQLRLLPNIPIKRKVTLRNSGRFWVRPNTRDINEVLAVGLGYEYPSRLFAELSPYGDVVFIDCGAHIGTFAVYASRFIATHGRIVCFEPESENYKLLEENIVLNNLSDRVQICHAAVAAHDGFVQLHLNENNNGHSLVGSNDELARVEGIPGLSLGSIVRTHCASRPYALKIDIEGAEYEVLESGMDAISGAIFVLMEWHLLGDTKENRWRWLTEYFSALGFAGESLSQSAWGGVAIWRRKANK